MEISEKTVDEMQNAIEAAIDGDRSCFDALLIRFEKRLRVLAKRMLDGFPSLRRWEETDDVWQNAMIRLHRSMDGARPTDARQFLGLAATQIRRTLLDLSRHHFGKHGNANHYQTAGGGRAADEVEGLFDGDGGANDALSLSNWTAFHEAVEALPSEEREVFQLVWYTGLRQQDVADLLRVNRRTVVRRLQSARLMLTQDLAADV